MNNNFLVENLTENHRISANMNATANGTRPPSCASPGDHAEENNGKTFAYSLILVVSLAGNTLIGIIVYKTKTMRRTINYFIVNMAMSDLLFPILVFPSILADLHGGFSYQFGQADNVVITVRFQYCVCSESCPDRSRSIWSCSISSSPSAHKIMAMSILYSRYVGCCNCFVIPHFSCIQTCRVQAGKNGVLLVLEESFIRDNYTYVMPFVFLALSFVLITILYSIILLKLKSQRIPSEQSNNAEKQRVRRNRNVLKMTFAVVSGFVLCWGPLNVFTILNVLVWDSATRLSCNIITYWYIVLFMSHANGALNPCICFTFSRNYR